MADISKITLPNGSSYDIKDATARSGLAGKAAASHTHDDRYYTETEMNTKLSQKVDKGGVLHVSRKPTSNGYLKFADITTSGYGNKSIVLWVSTEYNNGTSYLGNAIAYINIRGNGTNKSSVAKFSWLMKDKNFNTDLYYAVNDHTIEFYRYVKSGEYSQTSFKILNIGNFENASNWTFNLKSVAFVENTPLDTPIGTVAGMTNEGLVEYSNNADTVDGKHASDFAAASHKQAYTSAECTTYTADENNMGTTPAAVKKAIGLFEPKSHTHTKSQITDFPTIPTKTSQLTNDSGFKTTDSNTTYSLSKSGSTITLTGSDGSTTSVTDTDTNTWRGIQNNLTSDSTTDSLSAAQGKALKALVDGKAASSHTHTTQSAAATSDANASYLRQIATGTAAATTTNCPNGCLYGQYS